MLEELQSTLIQIPPPLLPDKRWDALVIGAGPAGSMAAIHLALYGHRVLLLDRERFPRDKACGDGLIADALATLQRAGLAETVRAAGHESRMLSIYSSSRIEFDVPGVYLTLRRCLLDALLARRATQLGVIFCQGNVTSLVNEPDGTGVACTLGGTGRVCRARLAVVATGARVDLLAPLGAVRTAPASGFAMRRYVRSALELDRLVVSFDRAITPGYAWIFPLGGGEYNIGCGIVQGREGKPAFNLHEVYQRFIREFPLAAELMRQGEPLSPLRGAMLRCGLEGTEPLTGRVLAIGESLGATFPFTGEGVGKAMQTGELAADTMHEALIADDPALLREFPRRLAEELQPLYPGYRLAQEWFAKPWLNDLVARRTRHSRFLREAFSGILAETTNPRTIFSWRAILKSFVQ